jgi:pyridoxal phosphate phosphatase PHOSPHO2
MKRTRGSTGSGKPLVVWDFDWSLINENSDTYVVEQLDQSGRVWAEGQERLHKGRMGWTELMDWALGELHGEGCTEAQIGGALATIPILGGALDAVALAQEAGAEQRILSDANTVYIDRILSTRGLQSTFSEVVTNPASYDAAGRLRVRPHQPRGAAHGCPLCPPNLCKGAVLQQWLDVSAPSRCIYVGDGGGDFCPATRLRAGDVLLARQPPHDGLLRSCRAQPERIRAQIVEWGGAEDAKGVALRDAICTTLEAPAAT